MCRTITIVRFSHFIPCGVWEWSFIIDIFVISLYYRWCNSKPGQRERIAELRNSTHQDTSISAVSITVYGKSDQMPTP